MRCNCSRRKALGAFPYTYSDSLYRSFQKAFIKHNFRFGLAHTYHHLGSLPEGTRRLPSRRWPERPVCLCRRKNNRGGTYRALATLLRTAKYILGYFKSTSVSASVLFYILHWQFSRHSMIRETSLSFREYIMLRPSRLTLRMPFSLIFCKW